MNHRKLGSNGPAISVVGFGAWEAGGGVWGANPPDDQTVRAMQIGFDEGINWIDTAERYGNGRSEELVARALAGRDDVFVFTKVAPYPEGTGFGGTQIRAAAEASLKRLARDVIDVYQLHWPDDATPIEETWQAMADLVTDGLVRWIGVSNFSVEAMEKCEAIRHVDSLQPHFSLLHRRALDDTLPYCTRAGVGVVAYGPLGYGLLTGAITKSTTFHEDDWRGGGQGSGLYDRLFAPGKLERNLELVEDLRPIAEGKEATLAQLALAWVVHQPGVTGAIAGSRSPDHVAENAGAGSIELSEADLEEIAGVLARHAEEGDERS